MSKIKSPNTSLLLPTPTIAKVLPNPDQENQTTPIFEESGAPFSISLYNITGSYHISILQSPFEEIRQKAEKFFLEKLNLDQESACKLKVRITTPRFANPDQSSQTFPLSFCTNQ